MSTAATSLDEIRVLLRALPGSLQDWLKRWRTPRLVWCVTIIITGAGIYGA
jgi:hypothetical protein